MCTQSAEVGGQNRAALGWLAGGRAGLLDSCQVVDEVQAGQSVPGGFDLDGGRRKKSIIGKRQSRRL